MKERRVSLTIRQRVFPSDAPAAARKRSLLTGGLQTEMNCDKAILAALFFVLVAAPSSAIERVYLKSGSTLVADSHKDLGDKVQIVLSSGAKVSIDSVDVDKIAIETSAPIDLSKMEVNPEEMLPDVSDPLNDKWLDRPPSEDTQAARLFLSFEEQIARGYDLPLAKSLADVRLARLRKVKSLEFIERTFYLGMDMQYHDEPGITSDAAYNRLVDLEATRNPKEVAEFLRELRTSHVDSEKEPIIAAVIGLRDRLDPNFSRNEIQVEGWTAQASRQGIPYETPAY